MNISPPFRFGANCVYIVVAISREPLRIVSSISLCDWRGNGGAKGTSNARYGNCRALQIDRIRYCSVGKSIFACRWSGQRYRSTVECNTKIPWFSKPFVKVPPTVCRLSSGTPLTSGQCHRKKQLSISQFEFTTGYKAGCERAIRVQAFPNVLRLRAGRIRASAKFWGWM